MGELLVIFGFGRECKFIPSIYIWNNNKFVGKFSCLGLVFFILIQILAMPTT